MANWQDVLKERRGYRQAGLCAIGDGVLPGVHRDRVTKSADALVDANAMTIRAVISTPDEDRSEDVVEPLGCKLARYALNPVVFFDHGQEFTLPIAKSKDDAGNLTVTATDEVVEAVAFFSQTLPFARQIFALWDEQILRATSINFIPTVYKVRPGTGDDERPGLHITEWELLEWSVVGIPDNPYAVAKALHRGKLDGMPIDESIRKMLTRSMPPLKTYGTGFGRGKRKETGTGSGYPNSTDRKKDGDDDAVSLGLPVGQISLGRIKVAIESTLSLIDRELTKQEPDGNIAASLTLIRDNFAKAGELVQSTFSAVYPATQKDDDGDDDSEAKQLMLKAASAFARSAVSLGKAFRESRESA